MHIKSLRSKLSNSEELQSGRRESLTQISSSKVLQLNTEIDYKSEQQQPKRFRPQHNSKTQRII